MVVVGHRKATTRWSFDCCISHVTQERVSQLININKKGLLGTHNAEVNEQLWRDIASCLFSMVQLPELKRWGLKLITWEGHNVLHRWSGRKEVSCAEGNLWGERLLSLLHGVHLSLLECSCMLQESAVLHHCPGAHLPPQSLQLLCVL